MDLQDEGAFTTEEWVNAKPEVFDVSTTYDERLTPLIKEIEKICREVNMPFIMRFFTSQTEGGNSSHTIDFLGGVGRATPELLAATLITELDHESPMRVAGLMMAAVQKFGGEEVNPMGIFMP